MGFRWSIDIKDESPFDCNTCTKQEERNCFNFKNLSDEARVVKNYTADINDELKIKECDKVFPLSGLRFYECPTSYMIDIDPEIKELIRLCYLHESSKQLLFSGGIVDQPYWFIEAIELLSGEVSRSLKRLKKNKKGK